MFWFVGAAVYLLVAGLVTRIKFIQEHAHCDPKRYNPCKGLWDRHVAPQFSGAFWPIALPVLAGAWVGDLIGNRSSRRKSKDERLYLAHERKMAEAKAKAEQMKLDIRYLELQGVKASVPGLEDVAA